MEHMYRHTKIFNRLLLIDRDRVHCVQYGVTYVCTHIKIFNRLLLIWNTLRHAPINKSTKTLLMKGTKAPNPRRSSACGVYLHVD